MTAAQLLLHQQNILSLAHRDFNEGLNTHAFYKINDHAIGEDLVSQTFMKTWKYMIKGGKIEFVKAFLYHVLNNLIVDEYRRHKAASLDSLVEIGFEPITDEEDSRRMFNMIDGKAAARLIDKLALSYQVPIRMRFMQGLSLKEISGLTGQTRNSAAVRIHRGMEILRLLYKK